MKCLKIAFWMLERDAYSLIHQESFRMLFSQYRFRKRVGTALERRHAVKLGHFIEKFFKKLCGENIYCSQMKR